MGDTVASNSRSKKYHKRSTWACDECKLRKKKCDGNQPCRTCALYEKECTYASRTRPSQPPTQRIRDLEEHIRSVRDLLNRLKPELSGSSLSDVDQMLDRLKPAAEPFSPVASPAVPTRAVDELKSMLVGHGRLLRLDDETFFHGTYSGPAVICSVLEFFEGSNSKMVHPYIIDLFNGAGTLRQTAYGRYTYVHNLPEWPEAVMLCNIVEVQTHPFFHFLDGAALRTMLAAVYDHNTKTPLVDGRSFCVALCHAVLALGYLLSVDHHQRFGCDEANRLALFHFSVSRELLDLAEINDLTRLHTVLCIIIFFVSTSRLSSAYTYISIAATAAIKQGLHMKSEDLQSTSNNEKSTQDKLLTTLVNIDLYVGTVLGLPPLINIDTAGTTLEATKEVSSGSLAKSLRLFGTQGGRSNLESLSDLSSKSCQIVSLAASVLWEFASTSSDQKMITPAMMGEDAAILRRAEKDLTTWAHNIGIALSPSSTDSDDIPVRTSVVRHQLELAFYWSQLLIYFPFLHYLRPLADGQPVPDSLSRPALTCLKVAFNTIVRCENFLQSIDHSEAYVHFMHPSNWTGIYTVFLAVVVLIFLISIHEGTSKPSEAWHKAETGIRILAALRCSEGAATRCIAIIKELVRQLNYTVDFDIEEIERSTRCVCERRSDLTYQLHGLGALFSHLPGPAAHWNGTSKPTHPSDDEISLDQVEPMTMTSADGMLAKAQKMLLTENEPPRPQ